MVRPLLYRILFVAVLFTLLYLKESLTLGVATLFLWLVSFRDFFVINKKVVKSILIFNLGVSLGYILMGYINGFNPIDFIIYINIKVYVLTYFVFWFFGRVNIVEFFNFSKDLGYLLMISLSQIISYKKTYEEFRLSFKARVVKKIRQRQKGFITKSFEFFLIKSLKDSRERSLAMKARGFF